MDKNLTLRESAIAVALLVVWLIFGLADPDFLGARNLSKLSIDVAITGTLALGMLLIILTGHIDLSAGSGVGLIGGVASVLIFRHEIPAPVAMVIGLMVGLAVWGIMGWLVAQERIPAFIITLGGLLFLRGLFQLVISNQTIPVTVGGQENLYSILTTFYLPWWLGLALATGVVGTIVVMKLRAVEARKIHGFSIESNEMIFLKLLVAAQVIFLFVLVTNQFQGVPLAALILGGVAVVIHIVTEHTPFGRYLYAIGGNEEAARISGIPVERVVIGAFCIMGAIVALTGFMQTAFAGASTPTVGELMELDAIAACVIGGASLKGGKGTVLGVLFGALLMASLVNGMNLLSTPPEIELMVRGSVLALAVWLDVRLARKT